MTIVTLLALSGALHLYMGARLVPDLGGPLPSVLLSLLLLASAVWVPVGLYARRLAKPPAADALTWVGAGGRA